MKRFLAYQVTVLDIVGIFVILTITNTIRYLFGRAVHFDQFFNDAFCCVFVLAFFYFTDNKHGK